MAKTNYVQYLLFAAIAILVVVGISNYGATPSGYIIEGPDRFDATVYECSWGEGSYGTSGGWHWIGKTSDYTWTLGHILTKTEAYCNDPAWTWTCKDVYGNTLSGNSHDCGYRDMEGATCTCVR